MRRRGLLAGLGFLAAAPAIIRTPGLLMPVKVERPEPFLVLLIDGPDGRRRRYTQDAPKLNAMGQARGRMDLPWGTLPAGKHEVQYTMNLPGFGPIGTGKQYLNSLGPSSRHHFDWSIQT